MRPAADRPETARTVLAVSYATVLFFPYLINMLMPSRVAILSLGVACLLVEAKRLPRGWAIAGPGLLLSLISISSVISYWLMQDSDPLVVLNFQRLFVELPLFVTLGAVAARSTTLDVYFSAIWRIGILAAGGAIVEQLLARSLLGREAEFSYLIRDGEVRGLFASEEPLVLGALLCLALPLVRSRTMSESRVLAAQAVLLTGIYCTDSRGPFVIGLVLVLFGRLESVQGWLASRAPFLSVASVAFVVFLLWSASKVFDTRVLGTTGAEFSTNYRKALYALLPDMLRDYPFGFGLHEIPRGVWLVRTQLFGVRDVAITVDSEIVYLALALGYAGVVLYLVGIFFAVRSIAGNRVVAAASGAAFILGAVLALHAWDTLGSVFFLLVGASIGVVRRRTHRSDQHATTAVPEPGAIASTGRQVDQSSVRRSTGAGTPA